MATTFLEPGGDADFALATTNGFWGAVTNAPVVVSDFVHGAHKKSIRYRPAVGDKLDTPLSILSDAGGRISVYIYLSALPTALATLVTLNKSGGTIASIRITTGGVLQLWNRSVDNQIGSNGATLSIGKWYRLSLAYTITSTSINRFEFFVNGISSISVTNTSLTSVGTTSWSIGNLVFGSDATLDFRSSDHYTDNSNSLTDTGDIWVTAKRPVSDGTTNGFTTRIGSGGSGYGTGHSSQVNERPLSTTNGWSMVGAGSAVTEEYNIESASTGDINISHVNIVDYLGWVSASSLVGETASIVVAGSSSNISLTSTTTLFTKVAGSTTYPPGTGTDIGIITTTALTTVSLYECGILVAYTPITTDKTIQGKSNIIYHTTDQTILGKASVTKPFKNYLLNTTNNTHPAGIDSGTKSSAFPTGTNRSGSYTTALDMDITAAASQQSTTTTTGTSAVKTSAHVKTWVSTPLQTQTIPAATWTIGIGGKEDNAAANYYVAGSIYILKPDGTVRGYIYDSATQLGVEYTTAEQGRVVTVSGSSVSVTAGDFLVFEWWGLGTQTGTTSRTITYYWNGTTDPTDQSATSNCASYISQPNAIYFLTDKTILGKASITVPKTDQTILGKARVTVSTDKTIQGKSRIRITTDKTILGKSRISVKTDQTILGKARVTVSTDKTIQGKSRIRITTDKTILGKSRISVKTDQTIQGNGRVQIITEKILAGKGRVQISTDQTILGKAKVLVNTTTNQTIQGMSRIVLSGRLKYWDGSTWILKTLKYWNGSSWVTKTLKWWNGSSWSS